MRYREDNLYGGNELNMYEIYTLKYSAFLSIFFVLSLRSHRHEIFARDTWHSVCVRAAFVQKPVNIIFIHTAAQQNQQTNRPTTTQQAVKTCARCSKISLCIDHAFFRFQKEDTRNVSTRKTFFCRISLINFRDLWAAVNECVHMYMNEKQ